MDRIQQLFHDGDEAEKDRILETPEEDTTDVDAMADQEADAEADRRSEELAEVMESLESLKLTLEHLQENGGGSPAFHQMINGQLESLSEKTGMRIRNVSLESIDGQYDYTASLEAITGILNRYIQVIVTDWKETLDGFGTLILGRARKATQYRKKVDAYRKEWAQKKPKTTLSEIVGSYASGSGQMFLAFFKENKPQYDPLKATTEDVALARMIMRDYPKKLSDYAGKVESIFNGAKLDSDESLQNTLIKKLAALPHPSTLMDDKYIGAGPILMYNYGLQYKTKKMPDIAGEGPEFDKLSKLAQPRIIKPENFPLARFKPALLHDVTIKKDDLDKLFANADEYFILVTEYMRNLDQYTKHFKGLARVVGALEKQNAGLSDDGKKAFRQACSLVKNLVDMSKQPVKGEVWRVLQMGLQLTYFSARMIAHAK